MKKLIKELIPYVVILVIVVLFRTYIATPVIVRGDSMLPNLKDKEMLMLSKITYRLSSIKRFDVVVLDESKIDSSDKLIIKRIIGLPGDYIEYKDDILYINGKEVKESYDRDVTDDFKLENICACSKIPKDKYLVLGDNRSISKDSRYIGLIDKKYIKGKAIFRLFPLNKMSKVK